MGSGFKPAEALYPIRSRGGTDFLADLAHDYQKTLNENSRTKEDHDLPAQAPAPRAWPAEIHPMLATLVDDPFSDSDWIFETKWTVFDRSVSSVAARRALCRGTRLR